MIFEREDSRAVQNFGHLRNFRTRARLLIPAVLHQRPQPVCQLVVGRSWWPFASHYRQHSRRGQAIIERNYAGKYLRPHGVAVSTSFCGKSSFVSYFDHDHRERENVCFLAVCSLPVKYLWRSKSNGVVQRTARCGIPEFTDRRETEICDSCVTGTIHQDIWLDTCQFGRKTGLISVTYSFEISMNYVVRVEKVKTLSNIR